MFRGVVFFPDTVYIHLAKINAWINAMVS